MKKHSFGRSAHPAKKTVASVSAAALMLGASHAATVAMHFQCNYCSYSNYSGFPVTLTAFGIAPSGWQNLTPMNTGYGNCALISAPYGYTLNETINTNTSSGGLNPLPNGELNVTWRAATANFSDFGGYIDAAQNPPYNIFLVNDRYTNKLPVLFGGNDQVYCSFLRDGVNFGPPGGANNTGGFGGYNIDIVGLHSVFTNTPFVVELIAASDSMQTLTNAFVIDVTDSVTNLVAYPNLAPVANVGDTPWKRGHGGGLSTMSGTIGLNADHLQIKSAQAAHGGSGASGFNNAGTISGFIITDQPVVTMSPNSVYGNRGDSVALSAYAIGVPPLAYQWRKDGSPIAGASNTAYSITNLASDTAGNYDIVVSNSYGMATSSVAAVIPDILLTTTKQMVVDSNPGHPEHDGLNNGAAWIASSSDGSNTRTGVMQFVGTNANSIEVVGTTNFDTPTGSLMVWMRSAGTDTNAPGTVGAALLGQSISEFPNLGVLNNEFGLIQQDNGAIEFHAPGQWVQINSLKNVSDNKWHLIVVTYNNASGGGATLYIDGVLDTSKANTGPWPTMPTGKPMHAGFSDGGVLRAYTGSLDDVRVYNRQLTAGEVASIYSSGSLIDTNALQMQLNFDTAPVPGLILSWQAAGSALQASPLINGTYTNVPFSSSPYYVVPTANQRYFRYVVPNSTPQARVSNPYLM